MTLLRRVFFLSQPRVEAMHPPRDAALISITDAGKPPARLRRGWVAIHRVSFDDFDPEDGLMLEDDVDYVPLSDEQALALAGFVHDIAGRCSRLVIHCRYGQSRSAAVARAVCDLHGLYFPAGYEMHNPYVYRAVGRALGEGPGSGSNGRSC